VIVNLPITAEKCRRTTLSNAEIIHLMEGISFTLVALKRRAVLWGTGVSEKSRLCCVASWISGKQCVTVSVLSDHLLHGCMLPVFLRH